MHLMGQSHGAEAPLLLLEMHLDQICAKCSRAHDLKNIVGFFFFANDIAIYITF